MTTAYVNRIGTAHPPHDVHDAFVAFGRGLLADDKSRQVFDRLADRAAISHRWSHFQPSPAGADDVDSTGFYRRGAFPTTGARRQEGAVARARREEEVVEAMCDDDEHERT